MSVFPQGGFPPDYPHKTTSGGDRINRSPSKMEKWRMTDTVRIAEGLEPEGPVWSTDDQGNIFYYERDLVNWLRKNVRRVTDELPRFKRISPKTRQKQASLPQSGRDGSPENPADTGDTGQSAA